MTTLTTTPGATAAAAGAPVVRRDRPAIKPIPMTRVVAVELRKSFDTRSGLWLLASIGITALLASLAVILWAPDSAITYDSFGAAIGIPMAVILPVIAILSVSSEWSQRSGLTTFTLVPHRGRVIAAKFAVAIGVGVVSMALAFAIGALGNVVGAAVTGVDQVWNMSLVDFWVLVLFQILNMMIGFTLGVLFRSSAGALVGYFVFSFVLVPITELLSVTQQWFADIRGWVDFNYAQGALTDGASMTGEQWAQVGVTSLIWVIVPLTVGLALLFRSEVK